MMSSYMRDFYLSFFLGASCGILLMVVISELHYVINHQQQNDQPPPQPFVVSGNNNGTQIFNDMNNLHKKGGDEVAKVLSEKIRILCWVMTQPKTLATKARAVKDTWGERCNVLLFMSSVEDKKFPVVGLKVPEGRENLWLKTRAAWKYVYDNHVNDADWFLKADDDSFVVLENLRYFVAHYNTSEPHYFGRHFTPFGGYNSGGSGYVFSQETLRRFQQVLHDPHQCKLKSGAEDAEVGVCLRVVGVHPGDTRDRFGRETFHPFNPAHHIAPGLIAAKSWLHTYSRWKVKSGPQCCSDHSIAFHYVPPKQMYLMEWLIYHLHPFGVHHLHD